MTVESNVVTAGPFEGNGVTETFSFGFAITSASDLLVYHYDSDDTPSLLVKDTDYSVSGIGDSEGGSITLLTGALATGESLRLRSNYDLSQGVSFPSQGRFYPEEHEKAIDNLARRIQQINYEISRFAALSPEPTSLPAVSADTVVANAMSTSALTIGGTPVYPPEWTGDLGITPFTSLAAMKAVTPLFAGQSFYLSEGGRHGMFEYLVGDYSAEVAADTLEGVYVKLNGVAATVAVLKRRLNGYVTPEMFGAVADDSNDSTLAIDAAIKFAAKRNAAITGEAGNWMSLGTFPVVFSSGFYIYNGTGQNFTEASSIVAAGKGRGMTAIRLGATSRFIDHSVFLKTEKVTGITFIGGLGAYLDRNTGVAVSGGPEFEDCFFDNYTECAIGYVDPADRPRFRVHHCEFSGSRDVADFPIAMVVPPGGGYDIQHVWLNSGYVDFKFVGAGEGVCKNIRFGSLSQTNPRINVWLCADSASHEFRGSSFEQMFHGNENLKSTDIRYLIAKTDTGAGTGHNDRDYSTASFDNPIERVRIQGTISGGAGNPTNVIESYGTKVGEIKCDFILEGTPPANGLIMRNGIAGNYRQFADNRIEFFPQSPALQLAPTIGARVNSNNSLGVYQDGTAFDPYGSGSYQSEFSPLFDPKATHSASSLGNATKTQITDPLGTDRASTIDYSSATGNARYALTTGNLRENNLVVVELSLKKASSQPLDVVEIAFQTSSSGRIIGRRVRLMDDWTTVRFNCFPSDTVTSHQVAVYPVGYVEGVTDKVDVALVSAYHARASVDIVREFELAQSSTADRPALWYIGSPWFDTTLGIPIFWDGSGWIDAAGTTV